MTIYIILAAIAVCIFLSGFFSAAEMSYSSCNIIRLENLRDDGDKRAAVAVKIIESFDDALSAILIGNNLVNIAASSLASVAVVLLSCEQYAWLATVIITVLVIIFAETIPKIIAKKSANKLALSYAYIVKAVMLILWPVVTLVVALIHLITGRLPGDGGDKDPDEAVEELQSIIETAEDEDVLDEDQSELLQAAIDFSEISAFEVMTARVDVEAIDIEDDRDEILRIVEESGYSRLPVYEDSIDNIIGVLYVNHFLKALADGEDVNVRRLLMQPCYVYKTVKLPAVLNQLRRAKQHLAIVVDEYGGTLGVLSMEDVLEQIVGEIWDENDVVEQEIVERTSGEYELDGDMMLSDLAELIGIDEESLEAESDTVGGFTVERFGSFPKPGDSFEYLGISVTVLAMDGLRVEKVLVKIM